MQKIKTLMLPSALFLTLGLALPWAYGESDTAKIKEQVEEVAEQKAKIADEETDLKEEAAGIEKERAVIEEKKAKLAEEEAEVRKKTAALAEKQARLAEKKTDVASDEAKLTKKSTAHMSELEQKLAKLNAKETERGLVLTLGDVLFESDQANLKADALENLFPMVTFLRENPKRHILIEGHTDSTGPESYNLKLSQERAIAVSSFLERNGIDSARITASGYGEEYPLAANTTNEGRQDNRRVEIIVLREGKRIARGHEQN